ncbi:MAG: DedA family protein [Candidatus Eremiobacteraeota bacterium]|nr:DedA family protein [Candidatus Eremiobacteraeota bacterium]
MEQLTAHLHQLVLHFGYAGLFLVMVLGNCAIPAGTEIVMPTAGALAAQGHLPGWGVIPGWTVAGLVGTLGEIVGGSIFYAVGYYGGVPVVEKYGRYVHFDHAKLMRVHAYYERFGTPTVFWCRFIPFVRGVSAFPAGLAQMQKRYFLTYTALGSAIFCFGLAFLGELAGRNIDAVTAVLHKAGLAVVALVLVVAVGAVLLVRARRRRRRPSTDVAA